MTEMYPEYINNAYNSIGKKNPIKIGKRLQ